MQYLIRLSDSQAKHMVVLTLTESLAKQPAIEVVFDVIGASDLDELVTRNIVAGGQLDDLKSIQSIIFDHDGQGALIRDGIDFKVNGRELDPDSPMKSVFVPAEREGIQYMRCDLVVGGVHELVQTKIGSQKTKSWGEADEIKTFARIMFLRMIAVGPPIDVTKEYPELADSIAYAESQNLIEIDVKKAVYSLSAQGHRIHKGYIAEALDLIKRFDIYSDVDVDASGVARFDTGLGKDLRIPAFELEGIDPFRARFLLGLNDGEWDQLSNWFELYQDPNWYARIFKPVEQAPSVEEIGRECLLHIIDQGKAALRQEADSD